MKPCSVKKVFRRKVRTEQDRHQVYDREYTIRRTHLVNIKSNENLNTTLINIEFMTASSNKQQEWKNC